PLEAELAGGAARPGDGPEGHTPVGLVGRHLVVGGDAAPAGATDALPVHRPYPLAGHPLDVQHARAPSRLVLPVGHEREHLRGGTVDRDAVTGRRHPFPSPTRARIVKPKLAILPEHRCDVAGAGTLPDFFPLRWQATYADAGSQSGFPWLAGHG